MQPAETPFSLFEDLYQKHAALKAVEAQRDPKADAKKYAVNSKNVDAKKEYSKPENKDKLAQMIADTQESQYRTFTKDAAGLEGEYRKRQQAFLHCIKSSVFYLCRSGTTIDWEANATKIIANFKKCLDNSTRVGQLTIQLGGTPNGIYTPSLKKLIEEELEDHKDQFSFLFFSAVLKNAEYFKESFAKAFLYMLQTKENVVHIETPIQFHSNTCLGSYESLRGTLEDLHKKSKKSDKKDEEPSISSPDIKQSLIQFAESFKQVKELGMAASVKTQEIEFPKIEEIATELETVLKTPKAKEYILKMVKIYIESEEYKSHSHEAKDFALNGLIIALARDFYQAISQLEAEKQPAAEQKGLGTDSKDSEPKPDVSEPVGSKSTPAATP